MKTINTYYEEDAQATQERVCRRVIALCPQCGDVQYDGHWHTSSSRFILEIDSERDVIHYSICTGCQEQLDSVPRGVLYVHNIPSHDRNRVVSCIQEGILQDCFENPQHKILDFAYTATGYMVVANNAATTRKLARGLEDIFEVDDVQSTYQTNPQVRQLIEVEFAVAR